MAKFYFSNALAKKRKKSKLVHVTKNIIGQDSTIDSKGDMEDKTESVVEETTDAGVTAEDSSESTEEVEEVEKKTTKRTKKSNKSDKTEEISPSDDEKAGDQ